VFDVVFVLCSFFAHFPAFSIFTFLSFMRVCGALGTTLQLVSPRKTKQTSAEHEIALPLYDISSHHNILELLSIK
jgi:hypothetical protein